MATETFARKVGESRGITPEMAREAYELSGLTPWRNVYIADGCGCALAAIESACAIDDDFDPLWTENVFGSLYVRAFMAGFDGKLMAYLHPDSVRGFEDGAACARAILPEAS